MFLLHRTRCLGLPGLQDGDCRPADAFLRGPDAARRGVLTRKGVAFTVNRLSFRQPFVCAPGTTTAIKAGELCEPFSAFLQRSCWPALAFSAGCSWIGETAGRAKAGVENAISDTKSGYHRGYAEGKS